MTISESIEAHAIWRDLGSWRYFRYRTVQVFLPLLLLTAAGCELLPPGKAQQAQSQGERRDQPENTDEPVAVKTARAKSSTLDGTLEYTGTTRPAQAVALRAQISGEIVSITADVGDRIDRGSVLAQLDGDLQSASVSEAQAELSARRSETAQAEVSISDAQSAVAQAQATLDQAVTDAARLRQLANQGAISQQEAEAAELAAVNAQQTLRSAQAVVSAQRQAVDSAADRINAQQAVVQQTQKQLSYADLRSPLTGVVLSRQVDVGDFVESGATLLELGDLSTLKVTVQVSELNLAELSVGQAVQIRLDAFPNLADITGQIERISPVADATSRLIPVEVIMPNAVSDTQGAGGTGRQIGSGLLARVQFADSQSATVIVPASALEIGEAGSTIFVIEGSGDRAKAVARSVKIGERNQNQVEILSGLAPDEAFVVQSDRPLTSGQAVRLSILSE